MKNLMLTINRALALSLLLCVALLFNTTEVSARENQRRTISGVVKDAETKEVLPGVSVYIKGATTATMTDGDGKYTIAVSSDNETIVFSYIGKKEAAIAVHGKSTIDVLLADDAAMLSEIVYTGYMTQKKADLTGSLAMADASDIEKNPSANALKSLQGKLPGVMITGDGSPLDDTKIQIRGLTTLGGDNVVRPLIVLDGMPVDINLRDINSADIENIQVLKDAASASIYGARAAGGVILIQTKKGKEGRTKISYDGFVGYNKLVNKIDVMNTEEYGRAFWQATVNDGQDPTKNIKMYDYDWSRDANGVPVLHSLQPVEWLNFAKTMRSADTDWFDAVTRTGIQTSHQLSVSSGNDKSSSLFSLGYYHNEGTQIHTHFTRYSIRMNSDYNLIDGILKVGENFAVSYLNYKGGNEVEYATVMPSIIPVYDENGGWGGSALDMFMDDYNNPVRILTLDKDNKRNFTKTIGNVFAELTPIKGLKVRTQFGVDYSNAYYRDIQRKWEEGGGRLFSQNGVTNDQDHTINYVWTNTALYNFKIQKHEVDVLVGMEATRDANEGFKAYREGIYLENRDYAILKETTGDQRILDGWLGESRMLSYFGKVNYNYDSRYMLSFTLRRDGSSKFGDNNRYGTFPAVSAGWRIKSEKFMEEVNWLSDLKLRASWGINGNSSFPAGRTQTLYDRNFFWTSYAISGGENGPLSSGYRRRSIGNPDLRWEESQQTNLGLDFGFLNQRLHGSVDFFVKETKDMLTQPPYIGAFGEGAHRWENGASMKNTGFEMTLSYNGEVNNDFQYTLTANMSSYKNKLTRLPIDVINQYPGNGSSDLILGRSLNSFYGLVADGIFKTQEEVDAHAIQPGKSIGRIRYKDMDGDGRIDELYDRTWIGISDPDLIAGLNVDLRYKGFDLTMFFQGVFGNEVYNRWKEYSDFWSVTVQKGKNHPTRILDAWSPNNPNSNIPALSLENTNAENRMSTYFIESGSYVKLRTLELGYTLPQKISNKMSMERFRAYVSARNIFTIKKSWGDNQFTGKDPENPGFGYQIPFSMSFGVNVTF